jgi:hypothetical protein
MDAFVNSLVDGLGRHFYQTVTIFTKSGGISGSGFTGTLIFADLNVVKLLTCLGPAPCCPLGSDCTCGCEMNGSGSYGRYEGGRFEGGKFGGNGLGSIVTIPTCAIAAFTHNTIG